MDLLRKIAKFFDSINEWVGKIFAWVIIPLVLLTVMEVIMRRFFNAPTIWSFEVSKQLYSLHFMIVAGFGLLYRSHVAVDIFAMRLPPRKRAVLDIVGYGLFFFPFCIIGFKEGYAFAARSWAMQEETWSVFSPPIYPIKTVIVVTFALLLLQGIAEVIKRIFIFKGVQYD